MHGLRPSRRAQGPNTPTGFDPTPLGQQCTPAWGRGTLGADDSRACPPDPGDYSLAAGAGPGNTTGLSNPDWLTLATPKK
jgi:hypothetical protein